MTKKIRWTCGFEKYLKSHEISPYDGENGLVKTVVFFGTPLSFIFEQVLANIIAAKSISFERVGMFKIQP